MTFVKKYMMKCILKHLTNDENYFKCLKIAARDYTSPEYVCIINIIQMQILKTTKCYFYVIQCYLWVWKTLQGNCPPCKDSIRRV